MSNLNKITKKNNTWNCFCLIFIRQAQLYWKSRAEFAHSIAFLVIASVVCQLTQNNVTTHLLLILLFFSLMLSIDALLIRDYRNNILEQFLLLGIDTEVVLLAKVLAHTLVVSLPSAFFIAGFDYCLSGNLAESANLVLVSLLLAINIVLVALFSSALCLHYNQKNISMMIALPFMTPSMIFSSFSLSDWGYIDAIIGLMLFKLAVLLIASSAILKATFKYK